MLQYLRNASNSIAMKIVFGLIMFGFCMWGVGDIIRNYQASRSVMKIGEHSITVGHFLNEFNTIKQEILRQEVIGEKVNINVKDATIRKLIAEYSFESMVERLKLTVSKNTMLELAKSMPEFQVDGQFNPGMYIDRLRASGMNEHMFLNYLRKNILRTQLVMPVVLSFQIPEFVKNRLKKKYSMQKTMQIWTISPKDIKQNIRVTEEDVKEYYASHPDKYQIPESRNIAICCIPVVKEIEIQESEIDNYLQQHKEMLTPKKFEERTFTMYMFPNQNYAYKGLKLIKQKRYKQVKTQLMPGVQRVSYTKTAMSSKFNSQIADAAFAIKAVNDASDVVFIDNMYCVFVLAKSQTKTLPVNRGQVRQQVKELLMQEHSEKLGYDDGKEIRNKIDDAVASGKTIEEIRDIFNLSDSYFKTIDNVQNNANSLNKLRFATLNAQEDVANVLEAIFATDKGEISQNIEINGGKAIVLISVKNIALKHSEQLNDIYKTVENDLIHDKEKQFIKNMIDSKDNVKDLRVELAKYNRSTEIAVSLFDLIMSANKQNANKNKKISDFISKGNNINILTDCVLSLNRDEWRYFDNNDGSYTVVIVSDAKPGEVSKDCSTFVNNMVMMFTNNGVPKCVSVACEKSFSIKVKQKRIDRLTEN